MEVIANEPMYVRIPRDLCTAAYGAMNISDCAEPRSVLSPELEVPRSKFWLPNDIAAKSVQCMNFPQPRGSIESTTPFSYESISIEPKQSMSCLNPSAAALCEQETVENKGTETVLSWVNPSLQSLSKEVAEMSLKSASNPNRWWTSSHVCLTCPLAGFPIHLLPYPPFKLRVHAAKPWPHVLVDGKFLALHLMAFNSPVQTTTSRTTVDARRLLPAEMAALVQYMHRCKLGRFRLEVTTDLAQKSMCPNLSQSERADAGRELSKLRAAAKAELQKLRRIQEQRLSQLQAQLAPGRQSANKSVKASKQREESEASTCSGKSHVESDENY